MSWIKKQRMERQVAGHSSQAKDKRNASKTTADSSENSAPSGSTPPSRQNNRTEHADKAS